MEEKIEFYYRAYMNPTLEFPHFLAEKGSEKEILAISTMYALEYSELKVLSHTPKGVWIEYWNQKGKKFVLNEGRKRYAYPTKEEAADALGYRLRSYIKHLTVKLTAAEEELQCYNMITENK